MAIRLTHGNVGIIPTTAEVQNMQRYQEVLWLCTQSKANGSPTRNSLLTGKITGNFVKISHFGEKSPT